MSWQALDILISLGLLTNLHSSRALLYSSPTSTPPPLLPKPVAGIYLSHHSDSRERDGGGTVELIIVGNIRSSAEKYTRRKSVSPIFIVIRKTMDAAKKKALFRAKLNAQKKEKRIDSPLVRYNEFDQPVCRICNVVLKSESLWDAHQASRKHHEAINAMKANAAARVHVGSAKPEASSRPKQSDNVELHDTKYEPATKLIKPQASSVLPTDFFDKKETVSTSPKHVNKSELYGTSKKLQKPQSSSGLPPDFFDNPEATRKKTDDVKLNAESHKMAGDSVKSNTESLLSEDVQTKTVGHAKELIRTIDTTGSETKQVKGALPEGFFDDKEADLRARGIKLVKPDVKDEYKEFEKLIQEDLQDVDNRMEEEEIDAAETIEEAETVEQRSYREKVEMLKRRKMELAAARSAKCSRSSGVGDKVSSHKESSSDDDDDDGDDENYAVDWRAQHL